MKKLIIKYFTVVICFLTFVGSILPVHARITFTNENKNLLSLNVKKTVILSDPTKPADPEDMFEFVLQTSNDGEKYTTADSMEYQVTMNGDTVYQYQKYETVGGVREDKGLVYSTSVLSNSESDGVKTEYVKVDWVTANGVFYLRDEWVATFDNLKLNSYYRIQESPKDQYTQVSPVNGLSEGVIVDGENTVEYTNEYVSIDEGPDAPRVGQLTVSKIVNSANLYSFPVSDSGEQVFTFQIFLNEKEYKSAYKLVETSGESSSAETDQKGVFTLKAGQKAVFDDLPIGSSCDVYEKKTDGWWIVETKGIKACDDEVYEAVYMQDSVSSTQEAMFTNSLSSFVVTKTVTGTEADDSDFTFRLTDGDNKVMAGATYYLYSTNGKQLSTAENVTDSNGQFVLKSGQAAYFTGIRPGTKFSIQELSMTGYRQASPVDTNGYVNRTVGDSVTVYPFVNERVELLGVLEVLKKVNLVDGSASRGHETFTFQLLKGTTPVSNAVYTITVGKNEFTYKTDSNGYFELKEGQIAVFDRLIPNVEYTVKEVTDGMPKYFSISASEATKSGKVSPDEALSLEFENDFEAPKMDIDLTKVDADDVLTTLKGAKFVLYSDEELTTVVDSATTDDDGHIDHKFKNLEVGTYYLAETVPPQKLSDYFDDLFNKFRLSDRVLKIVIDYESSTGNNLIAKITTMIRSDNGVFEPAEHQMEYELVLPATDKDESGNWTNNEADITFEDGRNVLYVPAVTKKVTGYQRPTTGEYTFKITDISADKSGEVYPDDFSDEITVKGDYVVEKDGTLTYKTAYKAIEYNKPGVYEYEIVEVIPEKKIAFMEYTEKVVHLTVTVTEDKNGSLRATGKYTGGDYDGSVFKNVYRKPVGDLRITKMVGGTASDQSKYFNFTIVLGNKYINGKFGDVEFKSGIAEFKMKHNQSVNVTGLPADVEYEVYEDPEDYVGIHTTNYKGYIKDSELIKIDFHNDKFRTPNTYDSFDYTKWLMIMGISLAGIVLSAVVLKNNQK